MYFVSSFVLEVRVLSMIFIVLDIVLIILDIAVIYVHLNN